VTVQEHWARVQTAEEAEKAAAQKCNTFGMADPTVQWRPEYEEACREYDTAWGQAEQARHEMDEFLHPKRYAEKGHRAGSLDRYRVWAAADKEIGQ